MKAIDVTQLPARPPVDGEFGAVPTIDEIHEGDLVAIYSRGAERVAMVEKVGKSNIVAVYTTAGAWTSAQKIHAHALALDPESRARSAAAAAKKDYAFHVRESDASTARFAVVTPWRTEEQAAKDRAANLAIVEAESCDEFVARQAEASRVWAQKTKAEAIETGPAAYVHVTRKTVKLADVIGWNPAS